MLSRAELSTVLRRIVREQWALTRDSARQAWRLLRRERGLIGLMLVLTVAGTAENIISSRVAARSMGIETPEQVKEFEESVRDAWRVNEDPNASRFHLFWQFLRAHNLRPGATLPLPFPQGAMTSSAVLFQLLSPPRRVSAVIPADLVKHNTMNFAQEMFIMDFCQVPMAVVWSVLAGFLMASLSSLVRGKRVDLVPFAETVRYWALPVFLLVLVSLVVPSLLIILSVSVYDLTIDRFHWLGSMIGGVDHWLSVLVPSLVWLAWYQRIAQGRSTTTGVGELLHGLWHKSPAILAVVVATGTTFNLIAFVTGFPLGSGIWLPLPNIGLLTVVNAIRGLMLLFATLWLLLVLREHTVPDERLRATALGAC